MGYDPNLDDEEDDPYPVFDNLISSISSNLREHRVGIDAELDASGFKPWHQQILAKHAGGDDEKSEGTEDENCSSDEEAAEM